MSEVLKGKANIFNIKKCPECKKMFYISNPNEWGYRKSYRNKNTDYCSWHCLRAADQSKEKTAKCIVCGGQLLGKSTKFCDTVCRTEYYSMLENEKAKKKRAEIRVQKKLVVC